MALQRCCLKILPQTSKIQLVIIKGLSSNPTSLQSIKQAPSQTSQTKLVYEGSLAKRILYLKSISILSSLGLAGSYGYVIGQKGLTVALAGVGFAFTPFLLSPFLIAWFFKRYVNKLYYDPKTETFTINHYGLLLNEKNCSFKKEDVLRSDVTSMLNTFTVGNRPFYLHDEDLRDLESIQLYKKMLALDWIDEKVEKKNE